MFAFNYPPTKGLQEAIELALEKLKTLPPDSDEYAKVTKQIVKLHKLKDDERPARVTPDTVLLVLGNIVGIWSIVGYERANLITTKALMLVGKAK